MAEETRENVSELEYRGPDYYAEEFGSWLDAEMERRGVTVMDLVRQSHGKLRRQTVYHWKAGRFRPHPENIPVLAEILGANPMDLLALAGYSGEMTTKRARLANMLREVPDEMLVPVESFLLWAISPQSRITDVPGTKRDE